MDLLDSIDRLNEAYCVQRGIPITRRYRDEELTEAHTALSQAERDINAMHKETPHAEPTA